MAGKRRLSLREPEKEWLDRQGENPERRVEW